MRWIGSVLLLAFILLGPVVEGSTFHDRLRKTPEKDSKALLELGHWCQKQKRDAWAAVSGRRLILNYTFVNAAPGDFEDPALNNEVKSQMTQGLRQQFDGGDAKMQNVKSLFRASGITFVIRYKDYHGATLFEVDVPSSDI